MASQTVAGNSLYICITFFLFSAKKMYDCRVFNDIELAISANFLRLYSSCHSINIMYGVPVRVAVVVVCVYRIVQMKAFIFVRRPPTAE